MLQPRPMPLHKSGTSDQRNSSRVRSKSRKFAGTRKSSGVLRMTVMVVLVVRRENSVAQRGTDIGHYAFEQCPASGSVVDGFRESVVLQVGIEPSVDRPARVDLFGEFRTEELPRDGV